MKKIIVVLLICLCLTMATGCSVVSENKDEAELKSLGFVDPQPSQPYTDIFLGSSGLSPIKDWVVGIPGSNSQIVVQKADEGWVYYPDSFFCTDTVVLSLAGIGEKDPVIFHQGDHPCLRVKNGIKAVGWILLPLGFEADWSDDSGDKYYYNLSNDSENWIEDSNLSAPLESYSGVYIPNISLQAIKDGAVVFFADDPHGQKVLSSDVEKEYHRLYSMVWDFNKGGLKY